MGPISPIADTRRKTKALKYREKIEIFAKMRWELHFKRLRMSYFIRSNCALIWKCTCKYHLQPTKVNNCRDSLKCRPVFQVLSSVSRGAWEAVQHICFTLYKYLFGSSSSLLFDRTRLQTNSQRNTSLTHIKSPSKPLCFNGL